MMLLLSFCFLRAASSLRCCAYHRASSSQRPAIGQDRVKHMTSHHAMTKQIAMEISLYSHHRASCMAWLSG